MTFKPASRY